MAVKYITVIKNGNFYCSFGTSSASTRILLCKLESKQNHLFNFILISEFLLNDKATSEAI
jgi:hypothetical protein